MKSMRSIFRLEKDELALLFERRNRQKPENVGECRESLNILRECGYVDGLCQLLNSHKVSGITGDKMDVHRRRGIYGPNNIALPTISGFLDLLATQFEDENLIVLIGAATIYLVICLLDREARFAGVHQALTMYVGVWFACFISALADWAKERQFLKIADEVNKMTAVVYRGAYGSGMEIPVQELVVGDIIQVEAGMRVPADCLLVEEMGVKVDETMYDASAMGREKETSETVEDPSESGERFYDNPDWIPDNHKSNPDPFLLTGSLVLTGAGRAVVCCVGDSTLLDRERGTNALKLEEQRKLLEEKLAS